MPIQRVIDVMEGIICVLSPENKTRRRKYQDAAAALLLKLEESNLEHVAEGLKGDLRVQHMLFQKSSHARLDRFMPRSTSYQICVTACDCYGSCVVEATLAKRKQNALFT